MTSLDSFDTIVAMASPPGPSERGIIRLSGPGAVVIAQSRFVAHDPAVSWERAVRVEGTLKVGGLQPHLPAALIVWPTSHSFTGEPVVEIHTVGSPPILQAILSDALDEGARLAEPGEFTMRAFLNGRIDLTRAEAVLAVIEARDDRGLEVALSQLAGGIARPIHELRDHLLGMLAHLEANLDFAEEPDVDSLGHDRLVNDLQSATAGLNALTTRLTAEDRPRTAPRVVLVGPPNAGKSRLFNRLAGEDRALVSPVAGTTRDFLSVLIACNGLTVELVDTAGEDRAESSIERQSQTFRQEQASSADLILLCQSEDDDRTEVARPTFDRPTLPVRTKADLASSENGPNLRTSSLTGLGLPELRSAIHEALSKSRNGQGAVLETSVRCRDSLVQAGHALQSALLALQQGLGDELVAVDLRRALDDLGRVVGEVVTDEILDQIFRRFCIGK